MIRRLAAVTALAVLGTAGAASAHNALPHAVAEDGPTVSVEIGQYGPSVLTPGADLEVTATVANPTSVALIGVDATLSVTRNPLRSSAALQRFLDDPGSTELQEAASEPVSDSQPSVSGASGVLVPGGQVSVALEADSVTMGMPDGTAGVYGVVISVTSGSAVIATRTAAITWYDAEIRELPLALVASATGSPERVSQVIGAASVPGASVVVDPAAVSDAMLADQLVTDREVFGVPSGDPDLTSIAHAEDRTLLDFALRDARDNSEPPLRDLPMLATIPFPDRATLTLAHRSGAEAGLLTPQALAALPSGEPVVDVGAGGGVAFPVLTPHARLSTILASYRAGMPDAAARLVAESALVAIEGDGTAVVVAPGAEWQLTSPGVSRPVADLLAAPWISPTSVADILAGDARGAVTGVRRGGSADDLSDDLISGLARQFEDLTQLSHTADVPNTILVPGGRTLLEPLASSLRTDPEARSTTYQASRDAVTATLRGLYVASPSDVNLIAASGNVPLTLHNDLDVDATVTVVMRSGSPNLVVEDRPVVTIPAGGDVTAHIAVTGVKSANVTATVALENATGDVVAAPQVMEVRVRADWGNAVTAIFTAALALLLIAGIIRTIRRGRRSTRMAPMEPTPVDAVRGDDG